MAHNTRPAPFGLNDVRTAEAALKGHIDETPIARWDGSPDNVILKLELFQRTGTFKARGAVNALLGLTPQELERGVTAVSAGNHAIATAYAAQRLGTTAKVVMPKTAQPFRVSLARRYGAEVVFAEDVADAFRLTEALSRDEGRAFIHPYDGVRTNTGAGTLGLELHRQLPDLESVVIAVGGGGLAGGVAHTLKLLRPGIRVYGVEPEGAANLTRSLALGRPAPAERPNTIADSLGPPACADYSFALCRDSIDHVALVRDEAIREAMRVMLETGKLAVEPAGAAALAGALGPLADKVRGLRTVVLVCGSNIGADAFGVLVAGG
jgi:threonine dehydratase